MSVQPRDRRVLAGVVLVAALGASGVALAGGRAARGPSGEEQDLHAARVVLFTIPGVTWGDVGEAKMPTFDRLATEGSTAALAPRTASTRASPIRGYLTLGAGNRAAAGNDSPAAQHGYLSSDVIARAQAQGTDEPITAGDLLDSLVGPRHRPGGIVHLGVPELAARQRTEYHGTEVGALGEVLAQAGIDRAVISAADRASDARPPENGRRSPVLALVDSGGVVPRGVIKDLISAARGPEFAFGVRTDEEAFRRALQRVKDARVVLVEPGETLRADEISRRALPQQAKAMRLAALERADALLSIVVDDLHAADLLIVLAPSSSQNDPQEHLTPVVLWSEGVLPGVLVSATTRRPGLVTLTDVAPTVLGAVGLEQPSSMSGRTMRTVAIDDHRRLVRHDELDQRAVFRERFVPSVFYAFVALFVVVSILVGLVFLLRLRLATPLVAMCYLVLSVPLATFVLSALPLWRSGTAVAHVALWSMAVVIAGAGWVVPGPRWVGGIPLLVATAVFIAVDLFTGAHLIVNAVFGNSVLAAGRFYGIPNTGSALFFGAGVLALAGIAEIFTRLATRLWLCVGLVVLLSLIGLPPFGADVGGLLTGVAAGCVILVVAGRSHIPWRVVVVAFVIAVAATLGVAYLDSLRSAADQTHLGRFGEALFGGDPAALRVILRKASQSWASLSFSRFTWVVPLGIAALAVLLRRPTGPLRDVLPRYPIFRAALAGLLVAGVLGFAFNDSGVAVPAMLLSQAVPLVVLLGADHVRLREDLLP